LSNVIFVLDRTYRSYQFTDFCDKNNIKYVIRFRNNCNKIPKKYRKINFSEVVYDTVRNNDTDKRLINKQKFKSVTLETTNIYTLVSNLVRNDYSDDKIKEIYHKRYDIEVFFKIIKHNFKFSDLSITNIKQNNEIYTLHNAILVT